MDKLAVEIVVQIYELCATFDDNLKTLSSVALTRRSFYAIYKTHEAPILNSTLWAETSPHKKYVLALALGKFNPDIFTRGRERAYDPSTRNPRLEAEMLLDCIARYQKIEKADDKLESLKAGEIKAGLIAHRNVCKLAQFAERSYHDALFDPPPPTEFEIRLLNLHQNREDTRNIRSPPLRQGFDTMPRNILLAPADTAKEVGPLKRCCERDEWLYVCYEMLLWWSLFPKEAWKEYPDRLPQWALPSYFCSNENCQDPEIGDYNADGYPALRRFLRDILRREAYSLLHRHKKSSYRLLYNLEDEFGIENLPKINGIYSRVDPEPYTWVPYEACGDNPIYDYAFQIKIFDDNRLSRLPLRSVDLERRSPMPEMNCSPLFWIILDGHEQGSKSEEAAFLEWSRNHLSPNAVACCRANSLNKMMLIYYAANSARGDDGDSDHLVPRRARVLRV